MGKHVIIDILSLIKIVRNLNTDVEVAASLGIAPAVISKLKRDNAEECNLGVSIGLSIMEATGVSIVQLKSLMTGKPLSDLEILLLKPSKLPRIRDIKMSSGRVDELIKQLKAFSGEQSDAKLAHFLSVQPPILSKLHKSAGNNDVKFGASLIMSVIESTNIKLDDLKHFMLNGGQLFPEKTVTTGDAVQTSAESAPAADEATTGDVAQTSAESAPAADEATTGDAVQTPAESTLDAENVIPVGGATSPAQEVIVRPDGYEVDLSTSQISPE